MMCRVLGVTTSGYYAWLKRRQVGVAEYTLRGHRKVIASQVKASFETHSGFAGVRTIYAELRAAGIDTTVYGVRKSMADQGLVTKYRKPFKRTTVADPNAGQRLDLVQRQFTAPVPTTHLCGDITYLCTAQGVDVSSHSHRPIHPHGGRLVHPGSHDYRPYYPGLGHG